MHVQRLLYGCLLVVATLSPMAPAVAQEAPKPTKVVGFLVQQYEEKCDDKFNQEWVNPHFEIGLVKVEEVEGVELDAFVGKPVVATGRVGDKAGAARPEMGGYSCVPQQARSDWLFNKGGIRLIRALQPKSAWVSHFTVEKIERLHGLTVELDGDEIQVVFENNLGAELPDLLITMHYEGCYGKPGAPNVKRSFFSLKSGKKATARFPVHHVVGDDADGTRRGRTMHVAHSVQVAAGSPTVLLDLDVPVWHFGKKLNLTCPERGPKNKRKLKTGP